MKRVRVQPEAEQELAEAAEWYEQRRVGLGAELIAVVDRTLESIAEHPEACEQWRADRPYRRLILDRFPFALFFTIGDDVVVQAIAHTRRRPGYWLRNRRG